MRHGIVLFTCDRGITPAQAAKAAEDRGFDTFYVPEHTHIPVRRAAPHPGTGGAALPDDRYLRTLDPWVSLATAAAVTARIRLGTAVALPAEADPITLAKTIATVDHLSGGRVTVGAGFGWNTDELADHGVPATERREVLAEYVAAMRALWTEPEAAYGGKFVSFGPCWAFPKPVQAHLPLIIGAGGGPRPRCTGPGPRRAGPARRTSGCWSAASRPRPTSPPGPGPGPPNACGACRTARPRRPGRTWTGWRTAWRPGGDAGGEPGRLRGTGRTARVGAGRRC